MEVIKSFLSKVIGTKSSSNNRRNGKKTELNSAYNLSATTDDRCIFAKSEDITLPSPIIKHNI